MSSFVFSIYLMYPSVAPEICIIDIQKINDFE